MIDLNAAQIRKDFSYFGEFGTRGVGYEVPVLVDEITRCLGLDHTWNVVIVGAGLLGTALAAVPRVRQQGFRLVGMFDSSATRDRRPLRRRRGDRVRGIPELDEFCRNESGGHRHGHRAGRRGREHGPRLGRPGSGHPQLRADQGAHAAEGVLVRQVDLSSELMSLSFYLDKEQG